MNKIDVCRGCMNEITNNGVSLLNLKTAQLYQNCTRIEVLISFLNKEFYSNELFILDKQR